MQVQAAVLRVKEAHGLGALRAEAREVPSEVAAQLLRHPAYEVRGAVLKLISRCWKSSDVRAVSLLQNER
jgi:hypothetical protein